ncbi:hypothetical protein A1O7_05818 [Cladophialophora yegresii CBS 114405]|uniref:Uncharacterized protein n=1 Tax=Cladophialophora yegresii CBS 114405 TaxID=1182544 RepID=W9VS75_9EURO|nr:uncharacterized protein A1O7_05818 [Cladophialophora yegresii CBS 114405]EXJ58393.1 hypothetical protein A1O7_05818 [Cladophialophora yegresii CBS 114405]
MPKRKLRSNTNEAASNKRQATDMATIEPLNTKSDSPEVTPTSEATSRKIAKCLSLTQDRLNMDTTDFMGLLPAAEREYAEKVLRVHKVYHKAAQVLLPFAAEALAIVDEIERIDRVIHKAYFIYQTSFEKTENRVVERRFVEAALKAPEKDLSFLLSKKRALRRDTTDTVDSVTQVKDDIADILEEEGGAKKELLSLQELVSAFFTAEGMLNCRVKTFNTDREVLADASPTFAWVRTLDHLNYGG